MKLNLRSVNKVCVGLLVAFLVITSIVVIICFKAFHIMKPQLNSSYDFEDGYEDAVLSYDYMAGTVTQDFKKEETKVLKKKIREINKKQLIHYKEEHKPATSIIVIQVHHKVDIELFKILLISLNSSVAVTNSLLIFSHGYYDDEINTLIGGIDFASHTQIYYPYSSQLFPDTFPGSDQKLCTNGFHCEISAMRYEPFAQKKHFWWWQMNYVFGKLNATKSYDNAIIFLEADQFVLRDFIYMARIMESLMKTKCPYCEIISLGAYDPDFTQYHANNTNLTISPWGLDVASTGIVLKRSVWNHIKHYSSFFCNYNDYRWDASLRHLGLHRDKGQLMVFSIDTPRIIKYRTVFDYVENIPERMVEDMTNFADRVDSALFPRKFKINKSLYKKKNNEEEQENGGWEDDRDRGLCLYLSIMQ